MLDSPPRRRRPVKGSIYRRVNWRNVLIGAAAVVSTIYLSVRSVKRWRRSKQKYIPYIGGSASDAGGIRTDYHLGAAYTYFRANVPAEESTGTLQQAAAAACKHLCQSVCIDLNKMLAVP
jgi:hypothetical protein